MDNALSQNYECQMNICSWVFFDSIESIVYVLRIYYNIQEIAFFL